MFHKEEDSRGLKNGKFDQRSIKKHFAHINWNNVRKLIARLPILLILKMSVTTVQNIQIIPIIKKTT